MQLGRKHVKDGGMSSCARQASAINVKIATKSPARPTNWNRQQPSAQHDSRELLIEVFLQRVCDLLICQLSQVPEEAKTR